MNYFNNDQLILEFNFHGAQAQMKDFVRKILYKAYKGNDNLMKEQFEKFHKIERYEELIIKCGAMGLPELNWKKLHDAGELCPRDYKIFKELKGFDPNEYMRKARKRIKNDKLKGKLK